MQLLVEDEMAEVTRLTEINNSKLKVRNYDTTIVLTCVALSITLLIVTYLASMSPGTAPSDFASMAVFP
jgi:hypothetical protein